MLCWLFIHTVVSIWFARLSFFWALFTSVQFFTLIVLVLLKVVVNKWSTEDLYLFISHRIFLRAENSRIGRSFIDFDNRSVPKYHHT